MLNGDNDILSMVSSPFLFPVFVLSIRFSKWRTRNEKYNRVRECFISIASVNIVLFVYLLRIIKEWFDKNVLLKASNTKHKYSTWYYVMIFARVLSVEIFIPQNVVHFREMGRGLAILIYMIMLRDSVSFWNKNTWGIDVGIINYSLVLIYVVLLLSFSHKNWNVLLRLLIEIFSAKKKRPKFIDT